MANDTVIVEVASEYTDNASPGLKNSGKQAEDFEKKVDKAKKASDKLGKTKIKPEIGANDKASPKFKKVMGLGKSFAGKTYKAAVKIDDKATRTLKKVKDGVFSLKTAIAGVATGVAVKKSIFDPTGLADAFKTYEIGFSTMLKSQNKGKKFLNEVTEFANITPFDTEDVVTNAQSMLASGWKTKNILTDLTKMGNASAALGSGAEGIKSMRMALAQMKTGGVLHTEEMNQLTEAGVNAWKYLSEAEGVSISKMRSMVEDGEVSGEKAVSVILKGLEEFDGMMEKTSSSTVSGLLSNIKDTFSTGPVLKWGRGLQKGAVDGLTKVQEWLEKNDEKVSEFGDSLEGLGETISKSVIDKLSKAGSELSELMNTDEFKNASLYGKLDIAWDKMISEPFNEWWESKGKKGIVDKVKDIGKEIGRSIKDWFSDSLSDLLPGGEKAGIEDYLLGYLGLKAGSKLFQSGKGIYDFIFGKKNSGGDPLSVPNTDTMTVTAATVYVNGMTGGSGLGGVPSVPNVPDVPNSPTGIKELIKGVTLKNGQVTPAGSLVTAFLGNLGVKLGSGATTATGAAIAGGAGIVGGLGALAGLGSAAKNYYSASKTSDKKEKEKQIGRGDTKLGMVAAGATAGAIAGSAIPVIGTGVGALAGAGIGGLSAILGGDKLGDWITERKKNAVSYSNLDGINTNSSSKLSGLNKDLSGATESSKKYSKQTDAAAKSIKGTGTAGSKAGTQLSDMGLKSYASGNLVQSGASNVYEGMNNFDMALKNLTDKLNAANTKLNTFNFDNTGSKTGTKVYGPVQKNAKGNFVNKHIVSELAEEGPEVVIPLSKHRERALSLWQKTGQILGVKQHAKGGIVGSPVGTSSGTTSTGGGNGNISVNVGGIRFEMHINSSDGSGSDVVAAIRSKQVEIADIIMSAIYDACHVSHTNRTTEAM